MIKDKESHGIRIWCSKAIKVFNNIGSVSISLMMIFITLDIFSRFILGNTVLSPYAYESVELLMVVAIFCSFGWCEINNQNICVDVLVDKLPYKAQHVIHSINRVICFLFCAFLSWRNFMQIIEIKNSHATAVFLKMPIYPLQAIAAIGLSLLCLAFLLNLLFPSKGVNR